MDVTVIIRAAGERTEKLCQYIVEQQVPKNQVFVIHERPFWKAVQKTFEIGLEQKRKWTLAVDADILLKNSAISEMLTTAQDYDNLYVYQGHVYDYVFGKARSGGPHLYSTKLLTLALDCLQHDPEKLRPESDVYKKLSKRSYKCVSDSIVFGIHDFGQWRQDLIRKAFIHAYKHSEPNYTGHLIEHWRKHLNKDEVNMKALLHGWFYGVLGDNVAEADINSLVKVKNRLFEIGIEEVGPMFSNEENDLISLTDELCGTTHNLRKVVLPKPQGTIIYRLKLSIIYRLRLIIKRLGK